MTNPPNESLATLLVSCPDRRGIVAALAQLLYGLGANILDADQHTDAEEGQFFQRIRFDLRELHTERGGLRRAIEEMAARFDMTWRLAFGDECYNLLVAREVDPAAPWLWFDSHLDTVGVEATGAHDDIRTERTPCCEVLHDDVGSRELDDGVAVEHITTRYVDLAKGKPCAGR